MSEDPVGQLESADYCCQQTANWPSGYRPSTSVIKIIYVVISGVRDRCSLYNGLDYCSGSQCVEETDGPVCL